MLIIIFIPQTTFQFIVILNSHSLPFLFLRKCLGWIWINL